MTIQEEIEQFTTRLEQTNNEREQAEILSALLMKFYVIGRPASQIHIDMLLGLAESLNEPLYKAWGHYHLVVLKCRKGELDSAQDLIEQAIALFEQMKEPVGIAACLNYKGTIHRFQANFPEAIKQHSTALKLNQETGNVMGMAKCHFSMGILARLQERYAESLNQYGSALKLFVQIEAIYGIADCYGNMGLVYENQGNYPAALNSYFTTKKRYEELGDKQGLSNVLNNMGTLYALLHNYTESQNCFWLSLKLKDELGDKHGLMLTYNNIGRSYFDQGCKAETNPVTKVQTFENALKNYSITLKISEEIGDKIYIANSYNNVGAIYAKLGNYDMALEKLFMGLKLNREIGNQGGISDSYYHLGDIYQKQGNYSEAVKNSLAAWKIREEANHKESIKETSLLLFNIYNAHGDYESALKFHEKYHDVEKEIQGEEVQKQLTVLNFQHNLEQKEKDTEIERLKNVELKEAFEQLKKEQLRSEQLFQNQLQDLKSSALQAQMNPHFVFNSLNSIEQFIWEKDPEEATAYLNRFSKLIRGVLDNSRRQYVTLEQDLSALESYIELESLRFENKFEYRIVCDTTINKQEVQLPPMIIQPFVENAILHGLQSLKRPGKLTVWLKRKDNDLLGITIEDNGVGRAKANEIKMGTGKSHQSVAMQLTKERLEKMSGNTITDDAITISDLYDENHEPAGTKVEIKIAVEYSI